MWKFLAYTQKTIYTAVFVIKTSFPWKYEEKCLCMCYPCVSPVTWFWYWGVTYRVVTFFDNILLSTGQNNAACNGDRSAMDEQHKNNRRQTLLSILIGVLASCWSSQMIEVPECLVAPPRQWAHRGKKKKSSCPLSTTLVTATTFTLRS